MAFVCEEVGRSGDYGNEAQTVRSYFAYDYATEALATSAVLAYITAELGSPPNIGGQVLARISVEETEAVGVWRARASWKWVEKEQPPAQATSATALPTSEDDGELSFDIDVETARVQNAIETRRINITGAGPALNYGTFIHYNPKKKVAEGIDAYFATFGWSETHYFHESKLTRAFRKDIRSCVGKTNDSDFRDNEAGEVVCMGVNGRKRSKHDYALTYKFLSRENLATLELEGETIPDVKGWDYVEVAYSEGDDGDGGPAPKARMIFVHRHLERADYSKLGIGS